jgi:hypothetical protein
MAQAILRNRVQLCRSGRNRVTSHGTLVWFVLLIMPDSKSRLRAPECLILIGATIFIFVLSLTAAWERDIRWLHFFQAWMYVATIALSLRGNRWGYFIGLSAAGLWDYMTIFANSFFYNGLQELSSWIHTGHLARPDIFIAVPAWFANFLVVVGSLWAYSRLHTKSARLDLARFLIAFVLTTGFFAADMAICQPRYLALFPRLLHPHLP